MAFADAYPHRRARLSAGSVTGGTLQCIYHGWRFGSDGRCVDIPALSDDAQPSGDEALGSDNSVNVRMRAALRLPFATPLSGNLMLVSYTGRKTGKAYRQPVSYVRDGYVLGHADP